MNNPSGIEPINGFLVIAIKAEETSKGGIIMPESTQEREKYGADAGEVIAAANDVRFGISAGQRVLFGRYAGTMLKGADGKDYRFVSDDDVKGIYHG